MCGKNKGIKKPSLLYPGSPPLLREKTCQNDKDADCTGITPACAGKIGYNQSPNGKSRDHPRVCGKNRLAKNIARAVVGSPPRVREKLFYVNKADTITYFRKFSQRCFLRSTFFYHDSFPNGITVIKPKPYAFFFPIPSVKSFLKRSASLTVKTPS